MKVVGMAVGLLLLVSCATPESNLQKPPTVEYDTKKSAKEVASCISMKWAARIGTISTIVLMDGFLLSIDSGSGAGPECTVSIREANGVTHVRYGERVPVFTPAWMSDAVRTCK
jgi:hypothetical protein